MSSFVTALKSFGQHFLNDKMVLERISGLVKKYHSDEKIMEIGPGMGALTDFLLNEFEHVTCVEVDNRCVEHLNKKYESKKSLIEIIEADFLKLNLKEMLLSPTAIVGNFPYNISSQIVFSVLDNYE